MWKPDLLYSQCIDELLIQYLYFILLWLLSYLSCMLVAFKIKILWTLNKLILR